MPGRDNGPNSYRYKYQGQEKDAETGMEAFEARLWDASIGRWLTIDPHKQFDSPYLGMGNMPTIAIDPDGRDVIIIVDRNGANGFGHIGILIGNDKDGWNYYSKNGTKNGGPFGKSYKPNDGKGEYDFETGEGDDFRGTGLTAKEVLQIVNERYKRDIHPHGYSGYIRVKSSTEQDEDARDAAFKQVKSYYSISNLVWSGFEGCNAGSCLDVVQDALKATKIKFNNPNWYQIVPNDWFINFGWFNNHRSYQKIISPRYF